MTARAFLRGQIRYLAEHGWHVTLVCSPGPDADAVSRDEPVELQTVEMARRIDVLADLRSLLRLCRLLRRTRPAVTNVGTPKAGLLVGVAAALTRVPCRIYTMRGLPLETTSGLQRRVLTAMERLAVRCAHRVVCVSPSLRDRVIELRLADPARVTVIGLGSSNGVDVARFEPTPDRERAAGELRRSLGIPADAPVVGFVGRLTRDKGVAELMSAWRDVTDACPTAWLLVIGDEEDADPIPDSARAALATAPRIVQVPWLSDTSAAYLAMDVVALPTYREGFPNVVLEAAAAGRPAVTTTATGAVDSVVPNETGLVVPVADSAALAGALIRIVRDDDLRARLGAAAASRVREHFRPTAIWSGLEELYTQLQDKRRGAMTA